tara:strand:- start:170 stop:325 length:156 start_codon:yes stop_codon:yes gene_type:complete
MPVPSDIETYSCMPDYTGEAIEYFETSHEALECLEFMGLEFDKDFKVLRVH